MKLLENKGLSILIMAALVLSGFWLGGYKSLNALYHNVSQVFFTGEDGDGICIENDLSERVTAATNLLTIVGKYDSGSQQVTDVKNAISQLSSAGEGDIQARLVANRQLDSCVSLLYGSLNLSEYSEKDESYVQRLYADFNSRGDTISHDPYNQYAQTYNQTLTSFPASLLAAITPAHQAVIFY